jgi:hypothetical protein
VCNPNGEDKHAQGADVTASAGDLVDLVKLGRARICWEGAPQFDEQGRPTFNPLDWACRVAWAAGDYLVVADEADRFMTAGRLSPGIYQLWNMGRHRRCRVFACSRRPARVSRDCTANVTRAAIFFSQEPADLRYLANFADASAVAEVRTLGQYEAIDWTQAGWAKKKSLFE